MAKTTNTGSVKTSPPRSWLRYRLFLGPLCLCAASWFLTRESVAVFTVATALFAFWFVAIPWGFLNVYLRYVYLASYLAVSFHTGRWMYVGIVTVEIVAAEMWRAKRPRHANWVELTFPFAGGDYCVAHGGDSRLLNHHYQVVPQRFALDILKLDRFGRSQGAHTDGAAYSGLIYDEPVQSPCVGVVTAAVDEFRDLPLGERDPAHPAGNHVVIRVGASEILVGLAHLREGSVCVKAGDIVRAGQIVGRVGNSGNTTLPHLHIHAKRGGDPASMLDGEGLPMRFDRRWLVRNSIVYARPVSASC
ncbi:MAG: M23 family metallopeptidase [Candidatus Acidiferrales bacterium]